MLSMFKEATFGSSWWLLLRLESSPCVSVLVLLPQVTVEVVLVVLSVLRNGYVFDMGILLLLFPCIPSIVRFFLEVMLLLLEMESLEDPGPMLLFMLLFPKPPGPMLPCCGGY